MSLQYPKLKVQQIVRETPDAVTLILEKPNDIKHYKAGQFLTLLLHVNGESLRRSYSLSSSPDQDSHLAVTVKRVVNGKASNYICDQVKAGDSLESLMPSGVFTLDKAQQENLILIGAGSGITPLMGILKTALVSRKFKKVFLIYGNRDENSIIFKKQLDDLKAQHASMFDMVHVLSQPKTSEYTAGRLNQTKVIKLVESIPGLPYQKADFFVCGPEGMMHEALHALDILKVSKNSIHKESFVSASEHSGAQTVSATPSGDPGTVTIVFQGTEYQVNVPANKSILQAALAHKIDLPYSCQSGLCTACMGKCTSGKIEMKNPDGLSDREIEQGYVLICVGKPVTPNVVIEVE